MKKSLFYFTYTLKLKYQLSTNFSTNFLPTFFILIYTPLDFKYKEIKNRTAVLNCSVSLQIIVDFHGGDEEIPLKAYKMAIFQ